MEKEVNLKTGDGHVIYGTLTKARKKSRRLVIFVHGLAGHANEHVYYNGARFFAKNGYDIYRFNLYDWRKKARRLPKCTISTHAKDVNTVVAFFKKVGYKKVFLVGHSLGGPTILLCDTAKANAIVFWDPSYNLKWIWKKEFKYVKELDAYIVDWGVVVLLGKKMSHEGKQLTSFVCDRLMKNIHVPIKIIAAGKGILVNGAKQYFKNANPPKNLVIIKNTSHNFDEEGSEEKLFKETLKWFDKF